MMTSGNDNAVGQTRPVLHFAHANGFPSACYGRFLRRLLPAGAVLQVPLLCHDPAYPVNAGWTNMADEVAASVRRQSRTPVIGIGHSMGGLSTLIAAHRHPGLFSAVILMDPPVMNGLPGVMMGLAKLTGQIDRVTPAGRSKHRREVWPDRAAARASLESKALFRDFEPECFDDYLRHGLVDVPEGVRLRYSAAAEVAVFRNGPWNMWDYRHPTGLPGAVITGEDSEFSSLGTHERLARQQHFQHLQSPGGHMFPLEYPDEAADHVIGLIQAMTAGQPLLEMAE